MTTFSIRVVDSAHRVLDQACVRAATGTHTLDLALADGRHVGHADAGARISMRVEAAGYETDDHSTVLRDGATKIIIGLRRPGQLSYGRGACRLAFTPVADVTLAHARGRQAPEVVRQVAAHWGITYEVIPQTDVPADSVFLRIAASADRAAAFADALSSHVRADLMLPIEHGQQLFGLTRELVVRFASHVTREAAERLADDVGLRVARPVLHAGNAFVLRSDALDYRILAAADVLAASPDVVYAEPNLALRTASDQYMPNDPLWASVPHLQLIKADAAWTLLDNAVPPRHGGSPDITIAVIDTGGVDPIHPDLTADLSDGSPKLVASVDFAGASVMDQDHATVGTHGTKCAGSATAAFDDMRGLPGVAPNCHLLGARKSDPITDVHLADIYLWLAGFLNGSDMQNFPTAPPARAADVISSAFDAMGVLSSTMHDCLEFLTIYGRAGKGCVLCFSLPNSGYVDFTNEADALNYRAWPSSERTIAVGASINTLLHPIQPIDSLQADENGATHVTPVVDTRAYYSPYGSAVAGVWKPDLVAPSHTAYDANTGQVLDPILACVPVNSGTVNGCPGGLCDDYGWTFSGTSHSTPTVAGAIALILSAAPGLSWIQVRDILRASSAHIDLAQANAIGQWQDLDGDGGVDYSRWYGAGRLDVAAAVTLALDAARPLADIYVRDNLDDDGDVPSDPPWWDSPDIWVRQDATENIPALLWTDDAPHQNPRRGQDNAVFCRVRNRGPVPAGPVFLRAYVSHWPGLEFVYPANFEPTTHVGAQVPAVMTPGTYLIGEARIPTLAAGADTIAKFVWNQALVPPATVTVGNVTAQWHPCLLLEAAPHDGPTPVAQPAPVAGDNNIAQRNVTIIDASAPFAAMIVGSAGASGIDSLVIDARRLAMASAIVLYLPDRDLMDALWTGAGHARELPSGAERRDPATGGVRVSRVDHGNANAIALVGLTGHLEIPLRMSRGRWTPLLVAATGRPQGDLRITQRRGDKRLSTGYGLRWPAK